MMQIMSYSVLFMKLENHPSYAIKGEIDGDRQAEVSQRLIGHQHLRLTSK